MRTAMGTVSFELRLNQDYIFERQTFRLNSPSITAILIRASDGIEQDLPAKG
jgi:hypothetical protein